MLKAKTRKHFLAFLLSLLLTVNPVLVPLAWADETTPPPENDTPVIIETTAPVVTETTLPPAEDTTLTEEPAGEADAAIVTADASAAVTVETDANQTEVCLEGELSTAGDPCSTAVAADEPGTVSVANEALLDTEATASAQTGDNTIDAEEDTAVPLAAASVDTGSAAAGVALQTEANTTEVALDSSESPENPEDSDTTLPVDPAQTTLTDSPPDCTDYCPVVVTLANEAEVTSTADADADTGGNTISGATADASVTTGAAWAWVNLVNLLNMNIVGSDFEMALWNYVNGRQGDVDLNALWEEIVGQSDRQEIDWSDQAALRDFFAFQFNWAEVYNRVEATASSGGNEISNAGGEAAVTTDAAGALANVLNLVNFNIMGSDFLLAVVNILGDFEGDLVLPRPEKFLPDGLTADPDAAGLTYQADNTALVTNDVAAAAETGGNTVSGGGETSVETGSAAAVVNITNWLNQNFIKNNWFFLLINRFGDWEGGIFGWATPDAVTADAAASQSFQTGGGMPGDEPAAVVEGSAAGVSVFNNNYALVQNEIIAGADTGGNTAAGESDARIKTGSASALVNLFNLINLNILGGNWFISIINILGDWRGNLIFAYPDVSLYLTNGSGSVRVGETTHYTVHFQNQGRDEAREVTLSLSLPPGLSYLDDESGLPAAVNGQNCTWSLPRLDPGETGEFTIWVSVSPEYAFFPQELSWWEKLIPVAHAAEHQNETEIVTRAVIGTTDPESDTANNFAQIHTLIYAEADSENESTVTPPQVETGTPDLAVTAWNNTGEFVYPGDTVTFELTVANTGTAAAHEVILSQSLIDETGRNFGGVDIPVGILKAHKAVKLTFGIKLSSASGVSGGAYLTLAQAIGRTPDGGEVASNQARTDFTIRLKSILAPPAEAAPVREEEVLGVADSCQPEESLLPWALVFLVSSAYLLDRGRRWRSLKLKS